MTILEKIKFEEDWLSEVNLTKENIKIAFAGIRATVLEQQPCEDCISRKETIEWLKKVTVTDGITFKAGFEQILYDIEQMPSVTPTSDAEDKYDIGYNCGYADAMSDIAESEG